MELNKVWCTCHDISDEKIKEAIEAGARTTKKVFEHWGIIRLRCAGCANQVQSAVTHHRSRLQSHHDSAATGGEAVHQNSPGEPRSTPDNEP